MKKTLLSLLTAFLFLSLPCFLVAQDLIVEENTEVSFDQVNLNDNFVDLEKKISVTNNTSEVMELKWLRVEEYNGTEGEWDSQICDNNLCYGFNTDTNYDPDNDIDAPFVLQPGETFSAFALHVWPRMTAGCGQYKVLFSHTSAPDDIIAVARFNVSVNTENCNFLSSAREEQALAGVTLYPNPSLGQFTMTNNEVVKNLTIYNILGKQMKQLSYTNGDYVDISELVDGLYLVALQNEEGQTMKTLRLSKRSIHP